MEIATNLATQLALSALSNVVSKLASNLGGDVTAAEMEHLRVFVRYEIVTLTKEAKSDDLVDSMPLLEKLQAAALELEDLLDLYEYNQIDKQVRFSSSNPIKKLKPIVKEKLKPILPKSPLRIGVENLLKFVEQVEKIHPFITSRTDVAQPQTNTVTPKTSTLSSPFYGRGDQCDMIIELLLDGSHADLNLRTKNVPIIAIRGLGGAGKTTTAQHIYNQNKIVNYFDLRMWVHVTRSFDARTLIQETIESAEEKECGQISSFELLQKKLKDSILGKKFLLVLDDVWEEDTAKLDILLSPLNQVGVKGSRIIVTTRTEKAANDLNAKPIILLDELKNEDCWSILKHHAFDDNEETIGEYQELKYVGSLIISKVKYSPLALKVVGSSLRNKKSANEWEKFLQQDILKETMDLLLFSYQCLPLHLQRCFAYCSLFPKGYKFYFDFHARRPHLIYLWIAQGFIENTCELTLEETGQKYIEMLLSFSFFEKRSDAYAKYYFVIHDLLHDLAEKVSKKQCHRIEHHDSLHIPTTCIHLSLYITEELVNVAMSNIGAISDIVKLRNLRSLIILCSYGISIDIFKNEKDMFQKLVKLRALFVEFGQLNEVLSHPHIDKLKHLRYLHVSYNQKLPGSLTKMYHLEIFILITDQVKNSFDNYLLANTLPQGFSNLIKLCTLQFYFLNGIELDYLYYNSKMVNIEKLTSLQNLKTFHPDRFNGMPSLRNLPLCGSLSIGNLENVKCKEEAKEARLNQKKNLNKLTFEWSSTSTDIDTCEDVLEGLEPHQNLEKLQIRDYPGAKFPSWINGLPRLRSLHLLNSTSLKIVQFLPPRLQELHVSHCDELMQLPPLSYRLRELVLIGCPKLTLPSRFKVANLEILKFEGFPNLQALTNLSHTLTLLSVVNCPKLTSLGNLQNCTSLKWLAVKKCPMLRRDEARLVGVVGGDTANRLPHVRHVGTDEPLLVLELVQQQAFSSINSLQLDSSFRMPDDEYFHHFSSLTHLYLRHSTTVPNLEKVSSLKFLQISDCPDVESLPNLPDSLRNLRVYGSPKLKEKYEEGGPLRNSISHIPRIRIR